MLSCLAHPTHTSIFWVGGPPHPDGHPKCCHAWLNPPYGHSYHAPHRKKIPSVCYHAKWREILNVEIPSPGDVLEMCDGWRMIRYTIWRCAMWRHRRSGCGLIGDMLCGVTGYWWRHRLQGRRRLLVKLYGYSGVTDYWSRQRLLVMLCGCWSHHSLLVTAYW